MTATASRSAVPVMTGIDVAAVRVRENLSVTDFANLLGVTRDVVVSLELKGKHPVHMSWARVVVDTFGALSGGR